jgi:hypothetical protein
VQKTKKEIVSTETTEEIIIDKTERVHSETNANGNKREVTFTLPENSFSNNKSRKVISWVYWIGVGKQAETSWKQNVNSVTGLAKAAGIISPLGALAIGTIAQLATPQLGEDVMYVMTNLENRNLFFSGKPYRGADYGKGIGGYRKFIDAGLMQGRYYLCMINDNVVTGIDVMIKVSAIVESTTYEDKTYTEQVIKPRYEKRLEKEPIIKTSTIPVSG